MRKKALLLPSGIYRLDLPGKAMDGWSVQLRRNRRVFNKYFSILACGSERRALAAALRYRARILRKYRPISRGEYGAILRSNNTSGTPGVCRSPAKGSKGQWVAFWVPESGARPRRVKFSVARYGEARAKEMAIAARRAALEPMTEPWRKESPARPRAMRAPRAPLPDARIARAALGAKRLTVTLRDSRLVSVPLWLVPRLAQASAASRQGLRVSEDGRAIEWPALRLRFALQELLAQRL